MREVTCELVHGLHDCGDACSEEFCRNLSHWSHLCIFFDNCSDCGLPEEPTAM